ncbi:hypothetical protein V8C42DRAFT_322231 [Trichoderma barbatum]
MSMDTRYFVQCIPLLISGVYALLASTYFNPPCFSCMKSFDSNIKSPTPLHRHRLPFHYSGACQIKHCCEHGHTVGVACAVADDLGLPQG